MRWIVGVDLHGHSHGALQFSRWVNRQAITAEGELWEAVHVLENREISWQQAHISLAEIERIAREAVNTAIAPMDPEPDETTLVFDKTVTHGLEARVGPAVDTVLVVGRRATREGEGRVRLGRITRRLARSLAAPVVVVPRDLPDDLPPGPVLLATSLEDDSAGAAVFAQRLRQRLGREVVACHVVAGVSDAPPHYVSQEVRALRQLHVQTESEHNIEMWLRQHQLGQSAKRVATGNVVEQLCEVAAARNACMIVVGSRQLSLPARVFRSSVASELASVSAIPVAIVPADLGTMP